MASTACASELSAVSPEVEERLQQPAAEKASYGQILKSAALVGGAQFLNIGIGIARTKAMAMFLGPAGFGVTGLYSSVVDLTQNIAGLGVNSSGVRQIAEAVGSDDTKRIALAVAVLRRTSILLGAIGALILLVFCRQISILTFGTPKYSVGVAILSIAAFCRLVSGGQGALIQGMRRITDLAKMNVLGAVFGAVAGVVLVYLFRENGIVPYLIVVAAMSTVMSWWYSRKIQVRTPRLSIVQIGGEAAALLKLGSAFMISSMMTLGVAYGVRILVLHKAGLAATGLYQSAWTIGGLYVSFILQAMGADFYPRLTASISHDTICNRLVNEQMLVGILLASSGVIATLTLAPVVISVLYSSRFDAAVPVLRWICLGTLLQVISWPMGFIVVAKGRQNLFVFCEVSWAIASILLAWGCVARWAVVGSGIAFFLSYVFHTGLMYFIVRRLTGFSWSRDNMRIGALSVTVTGLVFGAVYVLSPLTAAVVGTTTAALIGVYSARVLLRIIPGSELPPRVRRLAEIVRLARAASHAA